MSLYNSIKILPNKAKYNIILDICQGIKDNPQREKILITKEQAKQILKLKKQLKDSWQKTKEF